MAAEFSWKADAPQNHGLDPVRLAAMVRDLEARRTWGLLVVRHDRIVCEWYAAKAGPDRTHYTASLAKALVGGTSLMLAIDDGRIAPDDPASKYIPDWKQDPQKSKIAIRHLATHTSGIEDAAESGKSHEQLTGWKGDFWKRSPDPFSISLRRSPVLFEPGSRYHYSNPGMAALSYAVTASLRGAPHEDVRTLLKARVMDPIGVPAGEWSVGYGKTYELDGLRLVANWGGGSYSARAVARVGRLMLRKGDWDGRRLVSAAAVEKMLTHAGMPLPERTEENPAPASGLCWYTNFDGIWPAVPRDAFAGAGAEHQILLVVPSLDLIVVRFGDVLGDKSGRDRFWRPVERHLFNPIMDALADKPEARSAAPCPPSPVIARLDWAPRETIARKAEGSDCWPVTWADDDRLYTAYGDGWGFEPKLKEKLSLGLARVEGMPDDFTGVNLRAPTIEAKGDGKAGRKASGILMIDGVLYILVRNAGNAQLGWSSDHGKSWQWADWKFTTSFGCPTFLNFGRNYAGARDGCVYVYSFDSQTAYDPADRMVLARAPKDRLRERAAWEFFVELDRSGQPVWDADIARRGAVFEHKGRCYRSSVSYNAGLKRYLWWQNISAGDARFKGGLAVYDAPEPWGPWTTVYYNEQWDVGPGESGAFPTKWMSPDGRTLHLVFSGDDCFSVRRATLTVTAPQGEEKQEMTARKMAGSAPAGEPARGPLRAMPGNPRYFTDGSGRAIYLTGSHIWYNLQDLGAGDPPPAFDYDSYLRWMKDRGHNFMRLWRWELARFSYEKHDEGKERRCAPFPWRRVGPGNALDGKPKFDLAAFDQAYFDRLRKRVIQARDAGIYVSIMLFEGWGAQISPPPWCWDGHPFHEKNNVNGVNGNPGGDERGLATYMLKVPDVTRVQEAYVRKVIDTVNDLDNVLYEISNEAGPYSTEWQYHMIRFVKEYERSKPRQHPVGMTFQYKGGANEALFSSPADWISPGPADPYRDDPPAADGRKVILSDTDHLWGLGGNPLWVWKTFLRGMNPIYMDDMDDPKSPFRGSASDKEDIRLAMGRTLACAGKVELAKMAPQNDLASTKYCLAAPGAEYLVLQPNTGSMTVALPRERRSYSVEWFDVTAGKTVPAGKLAAAGTTDFVPPFDGPALLRLKAVANK